MPTFKRGDDVAEYPEELRGFLTSHGWQAVDDTPVEPVAVETTDEHDEIAANPAQPVIPAPETPAVPTTAPADDNTGVITND